MGKNINDVVERVRKGYRSGTTQSVEFRLKQLENLLKMIETHEEEMFECAMKDLRRSKYETIIIETRLIKNDILNCLYNLHKWVKPSNPSKSLANIMDELKIYHEPYGVVLIIGAWNYPFQLSLMPFVSAMAAGNCVILKPSEVTSHCARFLDTYITKYLDQDCYAVINGGIPETTELLQYRFDYMFFTGSTKVGKIIYEAANKFLTPVTLELGGKSPCYIDSTADMKMSVKRIFWGKLVNLGQTCIAADYVLCTKEVQEEFVKEAADLLIKWYGCDPKKSPDLGRIVNGDNLNRLISMINNANNIAIGGKYDIQERFLEPTVLRDVKPTDPVMQDEIFGPILPIVTIDNLHSAIDFINSREKPLALYIFSSSKATINTIVNSVSAGGICVNDTIVQASVDTLPFGGVGFSGMGNYHGKFGFDTFTHEKPCLIKDFNPIAEYFGSLRYPPYNDSKFAAIDSMVKKRKSIPKTYLTHILAFITGYFINYIYQHFLNHH